VITADGRAIGPAVSRFTPLRVASLARAALGACALAHALFIGVAAADDALPERSAIYRSTDAGRTWAPVGSGMPAGTQVSWVEPWWGGRLVVATDDQGLWIGDPARRVWAREEGLPARKITVLHVAGDDLFVGLHEQGIFARLSEGGGWIPFNDDLADLRVRAILRMPAAILVATDTGIFMRTPGRQEWKRVLSAGQMVTLDRIDANTIVSGGVRGAAISRDGGKSWHWIHRAGAAHNTAILDSSIVLMNISGDVFRSDDVGRTWRKLRYAPRAGSYVYDMVAVGKTWMASNNYGVHVSEDRGEHWRLVFPNERSVFIDLAVVDGVVYAGAREWKERRARSR